MGIKIGNHFMLISNSKNIAKMLKKSYSKILGGLPGFVSSKKPSF